MLQKKKQTLFLNFSVKYVKKKKHILQNPNVRSKKGEGA